jgi:hypothetical protein
MVAPGVAIKGLVEIEIDLSDVVVERSRRARNVRGNRQSGATLGPQWPAASVFQAPSGRGRRSNEYPRQLSRLRRGDIVYHRDKEKQRERLSSPHPNLRASRAGEQPG